MTTPRVSVIMPVYNAEKYLHYAIESILNQTFTDFELLILNDGSKDSTASIIESFCKKDNRIKTMNRPNKGLTISLIELIKHAKGIYLARHDADDTSHPQRFEKQISFLDTHPDISLVGSFASKIDPQGNPTGKLGFASSPGQISRLYARHNLFVHGSIMMRKEAYLEAGGYRPAFLFAQDYDLTSRLVFHGKGANIPEPLYNLREHEGTLSQNKEQEQQHLASLVSVFNLERIHYGTDSYQGDMNADLFPGFLRHNMLRYQYYVYLFHYYLSRRKYKNALLNYIRSFPWGMLSLDTYLFPLSRILCRK
ncbi:MAG: glycosyltransferase [Candidatus Auribacterota bacterium]